MGVKKFICIMICILMILTCGSLVFSQDSKASIIKISYEPFDKYQSGDLFVLEFKLKVQNTSSSPIHNVTVNLQSNLVSSYPNAHYFDVINSEEKVVSPEVHEITFESTQEPPKLVWHIQYYDINGNLTEEIVQ